MAGNGREWLGVAGKTKIYPHAGPEIVEGHIASGAASEGRIRVKMLGVTRNLKPQPTVFPAKLVLKKAGSCNPEPSPSRAPHRTNTTPCVGTHEMAGNGRKWPEKQKFSPHAGPELVEGHTASGAVSEGRNRVKMLRATRNFKPQPTVIPAKLVLVKNGQLKSRTPGLPWLPGNPPAAPSFLCRTLRNGRNNTLEPRKKAW